MYQFKYTANNPFGFYPPIELIFTCIVPANWLSKDLPVMGGCVSYTSNHQSLDSSGPVVFEFEEMIATDETVRTIQLDIIHKGVKCFEKPVLIHCSNIAQDQSDDECSIEVVLLNHLLGYSAMSALVAIDFEDFMAIMKRSSEFNFKFGLGETPSDILPGILAQDARSAFGMIFGNNQEKRMAYYNETLKAMETIYSEETLLLLVEVEIDEEKMLISTLVGQ